MRNCCELCGRRLNIPEIDYRNTAVCPSCLKGQGIKIVKDLKSKPKFLGVKKRK